MKKIKIAILDTGISNISNAYSVIKESYFINANSSKTTIISQKSDDYIGHGTAVSEIIYATNPNVEFISFRLCEKNMQIEENTLICALKYIYENLKVDIINISAGVTYQYKYDEFLDICDKLYESGVLIVSAFDNNGAISCPAMLDCVIGVDVTESYNKKTDIVCLKNSIVDILVPNVFYRTIYNDTKTIIKGTSFATAKVTGLLSIYLQNVNSYVTKDEAVISISNSIINNSKSITVKKPDFIIKKAIVFPINKESHALLRFKNLLPFKIQGFYDEKLTGNVGRILFGEHIYAYEHIDWADDFDTVILSCTSKLSQVTKKKYIEEIVSQSLKYNKRIYTFENIDKYIAGKDIQVYYPRILSDMIPRENKNKLHQITIPVVGVWGTSSKQGKYSLQLELIKRFKECGYNMGQISTEPSGYLFGSDFVFHCGYNAELDFEPYETALLLNHMIWKIQIAGKDIVITGGQSWTIPYNDMFVERFFAYQYACLLGIQADYPILCVNPHDDCEYIQKTIQFINSATRNEVRALVVYPIKAIETQSGISYRTENLTLEQQITYKNSYKSKFNIPVFLLNCEQDIDCLYQDIINYFSEN